MLGVSVGAGVPYPPPPPGEEGHPWGAVLKQMEVTTTLSEIGAPAAEDTLWQSWHTPAHQGGLRRTATEEVAYEGVKDTRN